MHDQNHIKTAKVLNVWF